LSEAWTAVQALGEGWRNLTTWFTSQRDVKKSRNENSGEM